MGRGSGVRRFAEIDVEWRQSEREGWVAVLTERRTKRQWEVRSESELEAVLRAVATDGHSQRSLDGARRRNG